VIAAVTADTPEKIAFTENEAAIFAEPGRTP